MRLARLIAPLLPVAAVGCIASAYPLFTDDDLVLNPGVVGTWRVPDDSTVSVVVTRDSTGGYTMITTDRGRSARYSAHLVRVAGRTLLDILPTELPATLDDSYRASFLPLHSIYLVEIQDGRLSVATFRPDSLAAFLAREKRAIAHIVQGTESNSWAVLTAGPRDLQAFLRGYWIRRGVLCNPTTYVRTDTAPPRTPPVRPRPDSAFASCDETLGRGASNDSTTGPEGAALGHLDR